MKCDCTPKDNPSVIGACACPIHGMVALRAALAGLLGESKSWLEPWGATANPAMSAGRKALGDAKLTPTSETVA